MSNQVSESAQCDVVKKEDENSKLSLKWREVFKCLKLSVQAMYRSDLKPSPQSKEWMSEWDGFENFLLAQLSCLETIVENQGDPEKTDLPSVQLVLDQIRHCSATVWPGSVLIDVDYQQINKLVGRLKTIIDAVIPGCTDTSIPGSRQNAATKDLVSKEVWGWTHKALIQSPQRIKDIRCGATAPQELSDAVS